MKDGICIVKHPDRRTSSLHKPNACGYKKDLINKLSNLLVERKHLTKSSF